MNTDYMDGQMKLLGEITYDICERWHLSKGMTNEDSSPSLCHLNEGERFELLILLLCSDENWALEEDYCLLLGQACGLAIASRRKPLKPILASALLMELVEVYSEKANTYLDRAWDDYCSENLNENAMRLRRSDYLADLEIQKRLLNKN